MVVSKKGEKLLLAALNSVRGDGLSLPASDTQNFEALN